MRYSIFFKKSQKTCLAKSERNKGFTLIESVVVMAIAVVVMATLVIQQNEWNDRLAVNTQTYELALMIRQAQIYSLGVREDIGSTGDKFNTGYGIYLVESNVIGYIFFADRNGDQKYNEGEEVETKTFTRGVEISDVCGVNPRCFFAGGGPLEKASVFFLRPETGAKIKLLNNGGNEVDSPPVTISLRSPRGKISSIKVEANGQVSITQ